MDQFTELSGIHAPATDVDRTAEFAEVEAHKALPDRSPPRTLLPSWGCSPATPPRQTLTVDGGLVLR